MSAPSALKSAAAAGDEAKLRELLAELPIGSSSKPLAGRADLLSEPLLGAAASGRAGCVKLLIDAGAEWSVAAMGGALDFMARDQGSGLECANHLLKADARVLTLLSGRDVDMTVQQVQANLTSVARRVLT